VAPPAPGDPQRYASMPMAKGISIDNYKLHEIEMPVAKIDGRYPACIRYPKSRIDYQQDGDMLILLIPPLLCVELFRSGVLPSKNELPKAVSIKISGKKIGDFRLFEIQYPSNYDSDRIRLKMTKR
jgi:hypothetical protein